MAFLAAAPLVAGAGAWGTAATAATAAASIAAPAVTGAGILGTLGTIASIASPIMSFGGAVTQAAQAKQQAEANADLLEYNKAVAEKEAVAVEEAGKVEELKLDRQKKLMLAADRAGFSASGFTLAGTPLAIMADTASQYEIDRSILRSNTATEAGKRRSQANIYGMQAGNQRATADNAMTKGLLTGTTSALSTYGTYHNLRKYGYRAYL